KERRLQAASSAQRAAWEAGAARFAAERDINPPRLVDAADQGVDSGSVETPPASPHESGQIGQVDMTVESARHVGGRPRKHRDTRAAQVAASRAYRARRKQSNTQRHEEDTK